MGMDESFVNTSVNETEPNAEAMARIAKRIEAMNRATQEILDGPVFG